MKKYNLKSLLLFWFIIWKLPACKKFVEIAPPRDQVTTAQVFADSANANAGLLGMYLEMGSAYSDISNGLLTYTMGLYTDELYSVSGDKDYDEFYEHLVSSKNYTSGKLWSSPYYFIYCTNIYIEGIKGNKKISETAGNALLGEAYCIRGLMHFWLVNLFGPVPIITGSYYEHNRLLGRSSVDSVYAQIIIDLRMAQSLLTQSSKEKDRINYYSATALLARVFLYKGDYQSAQEEATKIIGSGNYSLMPKLGDVFLTSSKETIWQLAQSYPGVETWEGFWLIPYSSSVVPDFILTDTLYNSFEQEDRRKIDWIGINTVNSQTLPYPLKYKKAYSDGLTTEKCVVLRLAEQYLIRAEARANLNDLTGAIADLNAIRNRAGLTDTSATSKANALSLIETERQHELFCEWGHRWFDLKRTNRAAEVLGGIKPNWKSSNNLLPIYYSEIDSNPFLTQNDGY